ncbi:MAG TPA: NAD(P)H-dependent oxidoreductase subunit E, partial [Candidatus Angelobacter sp.]|nr:NAD(P)H-dependent oxidoreductase subunit E [Candidatus Angelobacter sp.]
MDLHFTSAQPTSEERAAIDSVLGPPDSGWEGGKRKVASDTRVAIGAPGERHRLLPALHAVQSRIGWISAGAINYAALRLDVAPAEVHGVASFYGMFSLKARPPVVAHVCDDIACLTRGAEKLCGDLEKNLGLPGSLCHSGKATWLRSQCLGLCERAPAVLVSAAGAKARERVLAPATAASLAALIKEAVEGRLPSSPDALNAQVSAPQTGLADPSGPKPSLPGTPRLSLVARIGKSDAASLDDYRRLGGYEALRKALEVGPEGVIREVAASRLLGRGGAAFPTAKKWEALHIQRDLLQADPRRKHYVVCNADESEPGTFKDRVLMEGDPFAILEGMTIAAVATGAEQGYIYLRGEYPLAAEHMAHAIEVAVKNGLLGKNILSRGLNFNIEIRRGAGAYICGEET